MRAISQIETHLFAQRGNLFCWVPVCLGVGVGTYFAVSTEPSFVTFASLVIIGLCLFVLSRLGPAAIAPLLIGVILMGAGFGSAKVRSETVAAPILGFRYYGPIEGRVVNIDRSSSDAVRLTLDRVVLNRMSPDRTPARVRVSLHGDFQSAPIRAGDTVLTTGHLSPPSGPAEPGGFDFQRHAWFLKIGAIGYSRNPVVRLRTPVAFDARLWIFQARRSISTAVQAEVGGEAGAFAAAIMTGDRSGMGQGTIADLRAANLAHLLAISGLHMGLLTGFIFAALRSILALIPIIALRVSTKKIAAVVALIAGAGYLALSGGNVATERAYIMVAVMLVAVLLDRRALTLRAVAIAAIIVLLRRPEALIGPGFQMSFAATTALVIVFQQMRHLDMQRLPAWTRPIISVVVSSAVAGFATAPFAAAHFNQIAHFGLIANVISVPLMGVVVVPAVVLAVCLAPFGLWSVGLWIAAWGLRWILFVADKVANLDGAVGHVIAPDWSVLPLLGLGLLFTSLWQGRPRWGGLVLVGAAVVFWALTERPPILIADNGGLIGVLGEDGRVLSKPKGSGFVAGIWLENDGQPIDQIQAAARRGFAREGRMSRTDIAGWSILQVSGKTALAEMSGCAGADIVVSNQIVDRELPCTVFDLKVFRKHGAIALLTNKAQGLFAASSQQIAGARPWNGGETAPPIILTRNQE